MSAGFRSRRIERGEILPRLHGVFIRGIVADKTPILGFSVRDVAALLQRDRFIVSRVRCPLVFGELLDYLVVSLRGIFILLIPEVDLSDVILGRGGEIVGWKIFDVLGILI